MQTDVVHSITYYYNIVARDWKSLRNLGEVKQNMIYAG